MNRRAKLGGVLLASVLAIFGLAACTGPDPAVLRDGETRTSPSGGYTSEFLSEQINGKRNVYPVIKDSSGTIVWQDDRRYLMSAHPVGVVWQEDEDVLWLLSSDIGHSKVVQVDGVWTKEWDALPLPPGIKRIEEGK